VEKQTVHADVKFHSQMPFTTVDVCFRTREELEALIAGLQRLLESGAEGKLLYLSDPASYLSEYHDPEPLGLATEVCFHPPGHVRDEIDQRCLAAARSHLESLVRGEE
jgi:hypothetical protein